MKKLIILLLAILISLPLFAQKKKKKNKSEDATEERIPSFNESYTRFSLFTYQDAGYVHQETNDVWMDTFIELNGKKNTVYLPGLGGKQACYFTPDDCTTIKDEDVTKLVVIPIECSLSSGEKENRVLRVHYVIEGRSINYLYSLGYTDAKDVVLFHNATDQEMGHYLTKNLLWFE